WKGHIIVDASKMDKTLTPQQQQMVKQSIAATKTMVITLTMKANKTYTASVSGSPASSTDTGTWKQAGNKVTMTGSKPTPNGKPDVQTLTLSKDGKSMMMVLPAQMGVNAKVVFSH
ncbi:MAG TPA: hypothetical protein VG820_13980, partial [Fimbriimonadaceae bacterium]|nr:hypothetical protein [Fimbriimonadaceae bacterium]